MPNLMVALPNIGGGLCSTPQSLADAHYYTVSQKKGCHPNHGYNFVNSWSICKILSLLQRAANFQQKSY